MSKRLSSLTATVTKAVGESLESKKVSNAFLG